MNNLNKPILHFISGKLGSGKTTLAKQIASDTQTIFISEDIWLTMLYPNAINNLQDYLLYSKRFREMMKLHIIDLLKKNISVVLDFAGNVPQERMWVKSIFDQTRSEHVLHYIIASDELCRKQFKKRNDNLPLGSKIVTDQEFDELTQYFIPPSKEEGFNLKLHYPDAGNKRANVIFTS